MKTLNLTNFKTSDIKFEVLSFPDGQQNIVIDIKSMYISFASTPTTSIDPHVVISSHLNNFKDLELICCAVASLREIFIECPINSIALNIPYFTGARSDRKFVEGGNHYIKGVIAPIINSLRFRKVSVLDGHSDVLEACINNYVKIDNTKLVEWAINDIATAVKTEGGYTTKELVLVSPDAGAMKKVYNVVDKLGLKCNIIIASKHRDVDGKITHTEVPFNKEDVGKDYIIIDDICDGGRTFTEIVKVMEERHLAIHGLNVPFPKIYLIVTHGVFSKGFKELARYFDRIYTTNSVKELDGYDWEILSDKNNLSTWVKQLNVF